MPPCSAVQPSNVTHRSITTRLRLVEPGAFLHSLQREQSVRRAGRIYGWVPAADLAAIIRCSAPPQDGARATRAAPVGRNVKLTVPGHARLSGTPSGACHTPSRLVVHTLVGSPRPNHERSWRAPNSSIRGPRRDLLRSRRRISREATAASSLRWHQDC